MSFENSSKIRGIWWQGGGGGSEVESGYYYKYLFIFVDFIIFFFFLFATRFALDSISPFLLLFFGYRDIGLRYRIARNFRRGDSQSFAALSQSKVKLDSWGVSRSFEPRNVVVFDFTASEKTSETSDDENTG